MRSSNRSHSDWDIVGIVGVANGLLSFHPSSQRLLPSLYLPCLYLILPATTPISISSLSLFHPPSCYFPLSIFSPSISSSQLLLLSLYLPASISSSQLLLPSLYLHCLSLILLATTRISLSSLPLCHPPSYYSSLSIFTASLSLS